MRDAPSELTVSAATPPAAGLPARVGAFLDLIKFSHSIFAMPFALVAMFLAERAGGREWPGIRAVVLIVGAMVSARTFAMTFNRIVDRKYDARNPRTRRRPSVTGMISLQWMTGALLLSAAMFIVFTWGFATAYGNPWPLVLALPVLGFIAFYSYTKRFMWLCHFVIGASLGLAPICAFVALSPPHGPPITPQILWLAAAVTTWTAGFDLIYAMQDIEVDRRDKLYSLPARFGAHAGLTVSRICHACTLLALVGFGMAWGGGLRLGVVYWIGWVIAAVLLIVEQSLVKADDLSRVNIAFMTVNGIVGLVFGTLGITAILLKG